MPIFLSPTTDFGFKKLFGEEKSVEVLKNFLFDILELPSRIQKIIHLPQELLPQSAEERRGVLDLYCVDENGERFLVEMQKTRQKYFKDRADYYFSFLLFLLIKLFFLKEKFGYSTFPVVHQAEKGEGWQYQLQPIYCLAILGFSLSESGDYFSTIKLKNDLTNNVFYEKLTFVFIELPNFHLQLHQLSTPKEKWIYLLKHLPELDEIPQELSEDYLKEAFEIARFAALTRRERYLYEHSLKVARDNYAIQKTIEEEATAKGHEKGLAEGLEKGLAEGLAQVAIAMLKDNAPIGAIAKYTGLAEKEIKRLSQETLSTHKFNRG